MIELDNITKSYESPGGVGDAPVLQDISLKIDQGQAISIVGPSGSGKSTLLNIIGALDYPTSGKVIFDGTDLASVSEKELARIRNCWIGFVFQLHHLLPQCTVLENVLIPTLPYKEQGSSDRLNERAVNLLERVGLNSHMHYLPGQLSGGQRQRVAVVRALINSPKLLLADEPTGSLDSESSNNVAELLVELNKAENVTLIVVTHSMKIAKRIGSVKVLDNGKLNDGDSS